MKKLLSLLSAGILTLTGVGTVVSCSQKGTTIMEDIQEELSQNTEIIETIKKESLEVFNKFWEEKQKIDISNEVKDEEKDSFNKLVDKVKQEAKQGPVEINSENFDQYGMINHFYNEFKILFDNFNADLAKKYANYFANENPLVLDPQDVIFTGNFINFEVLQQFGAGFVKDIKAVTVTYEIKYSIRFKGQYNPVKMNGAMAITDDYEKLKNTSKLVSNYFITQLKPLYKGRDNTIVLDFSTDGPNGISFNAIKQFIDNKVEGHLTDIFKKSIEFTSSSFHYIEWGPHNRNNFFRNKLNSIINLQGGGQGKLPDGITPDDFVDWYMGSLPKNSLVNDKFPDEKVWYDFNIINNRILLAGLPLYIERGGGNNHYLHNIFVSIKKADLKKEVVSLALDVIDFYKMYQIESYWTKTIFYLPQDLFSHAIDLANSSKDRPYLHPIFKFIVENYNKEEKKSLFYSLGDSFSPWNVTHKTLNLSVKIDPKDSIIFTYDGRSTQDRWNKFLSVNIEDKNELFLGLVYSEDNSKGNQIEFKLKL